MDRENFEPTPSQSRFFDQMIRIVPNLEIDFEKTEYMWDGSILLSFKRTDPRPSRNELVDDTFQGHVFIGRRGGFKRGYIFGSGLCGRGFGGDRMKTARNFFVTLECFSYQHSFYF